MTRAAFALLPLLLWACEPAMLPAPSIVSVEPRMIPAEGTSALSVRVNAVRPVSVDYQGQSVDPDQLAMTLRIAGHVVDIAFVEEDGTLVAPVPEGLSLGEHDIRVTLADGREAVRERAFSVVPASTFTGETGEDAGTEDPDAGLELDEDDDDTGPKDGIWFYWVESIKDQVRDVPFKVTVHAVGPRARHFQEPVTVRANRGKLKTVSHGTFKGGVRIDEVSLDHPGPNIYLLVEDAHGNKGLSNAFRVRAR